MDGEGLISNTNEIVGLWVAAKDARRPDWLDSVEKKINVSAVLADRQFEISEDLKVTPIFFLDANIVSQYPEILEELLKTEQKSFWIIWVRSSDSPLPSMQYINMDEVLGILSETSPAEEVDMLLRRAQVKKDKVLSRETLFSDVKEQNQQLEVMTLDLEKLVKNRTEDILTSKTEVEEKVTRVKSLVSFIKSLSNVRQVEDLLLLIRNEIKKVHSFGEPFLACETGQFGPWILFSHRGLVSEIRTNSMWKIGSRLRINDPDDQLYLANVFSRPFQRVIGLPLQTQGNQSNNITLFVEHQLDSTQINRFIDYMGERLQSLGLALDRSLLEIDLKRASFLWESTFDSIDDPIAILNQDEVVIRANQAYYEVIDSQAGGFSGLKIPQGEGSPIQKSIRKREASYASLRWQKKFFDMHCYPILFGENEEPASVVCHFIDMTNFRSLQSSMIQNEKMSAIGHLAGNIAHELNNPLTGIRGICQILLAETSENEQIYKDLREVESAAGRSQKIITNLLNFSKGAQDKARETVDLNDLVEITLPLLKSITSEHERDMELSSDNTNVKVEPHITQQVIFNLINNACQAMSEPGFLKISTEVSDGHVFFKVQDSGPGIPETLGLTIFDPFVTTKSEKGGTGLGLSMSRKVIEKFGGSIGFENQETGALFWFKLPSDNKGGLD